MMSIELPVSLWDMGVINGCQLPLVLQPGSRRWASTQSWLQHLTCASFWKLRRLPKGQISINIIRKHHVNSWQAIYISQSVASSPHRLPTVPTFRQRRNSCRGERQIRSNLREDVDGRDLGSTDLPGIPPSPGGRGASPIFAATCTALKLEGQETPSQPAWLRLAETAGIQSHTRYSNGSTSHGKFETIKIMWPPERTTSLMYVYIYIKYTGYIYIYIYCIYWISIYIYIYIIFTYIIHMSYNIIWLSDLVSKNGECGMDVIRFLLVWCCRIDSSPSW